MLRRITYLLIVLSTSFIAFEGTTTMAQVTATADVNPAPDYSDAKDWVCRPGKEETCTLGLDAKVLYADGSSSIEHFEPAENPPVDCFYVYPTVSTEKRDFATLVDGPEIREATKEQVGRLTSKCRVFAPLYRQATLQYLQSKSKVPPVYPKADIRNAWDYYWTHYNNGTRGVILIGHSQGTLLLQGLLKNVIQTKPDQLSHLVSAFLAGDPSLPLDPGSLSGSKLTDIPVCSTASEIHCVYAWGSYLKDDSSDLVNPIFGGPPKKYPNEVSACVNPSAPDGEMGILAFYSRNEDSRLLTPPFIKYVGALSGRCETVDATGNVFEVTILPGLHAQELNLLLNSKSLSDGVGLHELDIPLVEGNIVDVVDLESQTWERDRTLHAR